MLYRLEELGVERRLGRGEAIEAVGGGPLARLALRGLLRRGDVRREGHLLGLTDRGREQAGGLVRAHRLWEAYLVEHLGLAPDHVHEPAMRTEHYLGATLRERVAAEVADAETDPHGRDIPP
jgi:Mn-dependent DtxR family transcriptional regulator